MSLSPTVYRFGAGGKLIPIETRIDAIGQRVIQDNYGEVGVICELRSSGYLVIFPDGSSSDGQQFDCLSPFTRIRPVEPEQYADDAEIEMLRKLSVQHRNDVAAAAKLAAEKKAQDKAEIIKKLRAEYPNAKGPKSFKTSAARAAANLRAELKAKFPGVKFEVKSQTYSGGNSIDIHWTDGPSMNDVDAIANRYQDGSFDGMQDLHEYDHSAFGEAFDIVCGRAKYVSTHRHHSPAVLQSTVEMLSALKGWENPPVVKTSDYDGNGYLELDDYHQRSDIYELLRNTDLRF